MSTKRTTLLFLCTNAHWAAINVTSIHIINKLAASLCAFTQERSVHNCSTLQARAPIGYELASLAVLPANSLKKLQPSIAVHVLWLTNWFQKKQLTVVIPCQFLHHTFIYYCQWRKVLTAWSILLRQSGQFVKCEEQAIQQHMWPHGTKTALYSCSRHITHISSTN